MWLRERTAPGLGIIENRTMFLRGMLFGIGICLVGSDYINSANAQQTDQQIIVTKAEAALAAKIKCGDFRKNANGTWTSGLNTKIGASAFPKHTFDIHGVTIGGADLATVLKVRRGGLRPVHKIDHPNRQGRRKPQARPLPSRVPPPTRKKVPSQTGMIPIAKAPSREPKNS
jgi:hypothetical protein